MLILMYRNYLFLQEKSSSKHIYNSFSRIFLVRYMLCIQILINNRSTVIKIDIFLYKINNNIIIKISVLYEVTKFEEKI